MNIHLGSHYFGADTVNENFHLKNQVEQLVSDLSRFVPSDQPLILGGDFNFGYESNFYHFLIRELGLQDSVKDFGIVTFAKENLNRLSWFTNGGSQHEKLDFLLYRKLPFKDVSAKLVFDQPMEFGLIKYHISDHYGLEMTAT